MRTGNEVRGHVPKVHVPISRYQPGLAVEAMYDAALHANTKGQWVEIVQ